jgi:ketosteroid isomerase-like protein
MSRRPRPSQSVLERLPVEREQPIELLRRGWDAYIRGDVDGVLAITHPEVEWDMTRLDGARL